MWVAVTSVQRAVSKSLECVECLVSRGAGVRRSTASGRVARVEWVVRRGTGGAVRGVLQGGVCGE